MRTSDVIVVGGGIIGLSLALSLRKRGLRVLLIERGEPGREASHAAAGMLVSDPSEHAPEVQALASASAGMYPEFVHELEDESGQKVDLRDCGALVLSGTTEEFGDTSASSPLAAEPALAHLKLSARYLEERSVDPRALASAALKAAKHREVDFVTGSAVHEVRTENNRVTGVATDRATYSAPVVVNCAGAWSGGLPGNFPVRPVKGQILSVIGGPSIRHVVRAPEVYLVPRSDGRLVVGATIEEAGYDKRTEPATIQRLLRSATDLIPSLATAQIHEAWAGLRPGTPDNLPILGVTETPGYFVATGHFRDGILLSPITARVMAQLVAGETPEYDLSALSPQRFAS